MTEDTTTTTTAMEATVVPADETMQTEAADTMVENTAQDGSEAPQDENAVGDENPFALDDGEEEGDETPAADEAEGEEDVFNLEAPEGMQIADDYREIYAQCAKEVGVKGKQAAAYIKAVLEAERNHTAKLLDSQEADLRKEWGAKFNDNVTAAKQFARKLAGKAGVPMQVMKGVFETPMGCRLLHAMREAMGAQFVQGGAVNGGTNEEEANAMLRDPKNAWYEAMYDPAHPRHKEANARYNRLMGFEA